MMYRLIPILVGLVLGGCGALSAVTSAEDSERRLVGDSGRLSTDGLGVDVEGVVSDDPPVNPVRTDDPTASDGEPTSSDNNSDGSGVADDVLLIDIPGGQPVEPIIPGGPETVEPIDPSILDPLSFLLTDPELFADFVPFVTDTLLLDLLAPSTSSGGGSFADSFTNLELLCQDVGISDSFCRRSFAD